MTPPGTGIDTVPCEPTGIVIPSCHHNHVTPSKPRSKFQFSNPTAQAAEARLNAAEARALADKHAPKHLREAAPETTAAGACFRNVSRILAGKGAK